MRPTNPELTKRARSQRQASKRSKADPPSRTETLTAPVKSRRLPAVVPVLTILVAALFVLFFRSLEPDYTLFSNDGPLGRLMSQCQRLPGRFTGAWMDLNSIGYSQGAAWPNITSLLLILLGPIGFSKLYAPLALLILGVSAWCFFRQLGLAPLACVLGALASSLNSGFFSTACWGVAAHPLSVAMSFLALAALVNRAPRSHWLKAAVGGVAVGISVAEGADVGAIFSFYVAAFALYRWLQAEGPIFKRLTRGIGEVLLMAGIAGLVAAQAVWVLADTQLRAIPGPQATNQTWQTRWDWATKWSLPKRETLTFIIPGLFGYRMDTPDGGNYWGAVGREPAWDRYFKNGRQGEKPTGLMRFAGGGNYAGILVVVVALWAAFQAWSSRGSAFERTGRMHIYFWIAVLLGSLLMAYGRYAPLYRIFYELPYSSSIRNPAKFVHVVNWALIVLFTYGVHGLSNLYLRRSASSRRKTVGEWWDQANRFERNWLIGCLMAIGGSLVAAFIYNCSGLSLAKYLQDVGFDANVSSQVVTFSLHEVSWYLVFLALAVSLVLAISMGQFAGPNSRWAAILLGVFLVVDLGRANQPWIIYWNYAQKYTLDPVIDLLRQAPYEHRVASIPKWLPYQFNLPQSLLSQANHWEDAYQTEWLQQLFPYNDIQSLDVVQLRTIPPDLVKFEDALQYQGPGTSLQVLARRWQLTNTRYLLGCAELLPVLNQVVDPIQQRFKIQSRFDFVSKPGVLNPLAFQDVTPAFSRQGPYALFEFTGALPRASLYTNWQVAADDTEALKLMTNTNLNPADTVVVSTPPAISPGPFAQNAGSVSFVSYSPKQVLLRAIAPSPSVLLLNDRFDPNWKVSIDGQPATLLRCNFIMRGVAVPAGDHRIQFQFGPRLGPLYVSVAAIAIGLLLTGILLAGGPKPQPVSSPN
jgi:hypothetical protein